MPIPLPNLDDRTFDDLVAEGKRLIPGLAPSWTDHNPSDPGITLIELFACVTEMLLYRVDRIGDVNKLAFLRLLRGAPGLEEPTGPIDEALAAAIVALRTEQRAVTAADLERLARSFEGVARAHCVPEVDLESGAPDALAKGHLSLVVVPTATTSGYPFAPTDLLVRVKGNRDAPTPDGGLDARCLLATHLHLVPAKPRPLKLSATLHLYPEGSAQEVQEQAQREIERYLDPLLGGADGSGWSFGSDLQPSRFYALLDGLDGVDYVSALLLDLDGQQGSWTTKANELPQLAEGGLSLSIQRQGTRPGAES